jgi:hypothetical protein
MWDVHMGMLLYIRRADQVLYIYQEVDDNKINEDMFLRAARTHSLLISGGTSYSDIRHLGSFTIV